MELFFLRHGLAVERGTPGFSTDADRPLTPKGRRQLRKIAAAMRQLDLSFDAIFSSSFLRARQTAAIVAADLKLKNRLAFAGELQPGGAAEKLIRRLQALESEPGKILLVGHEPDLGELLAWLVTGETGAGFALQKGGLAKLEIKKLRAGKCAVLAWLLTPAQLKLMR